MTEIEQDLENEEGKVRYAYKDSKGIWTIGVGFNIDKDHNGGLDDTEISFILQHRIDKASAAVLKRFPFLVTLDDTRHDIIVQMAYQMGVDGLAAFIHFMEAVSQHNWVVASKEMMDSKWAKVDSPARAARLSKRMLTGVHE